MTRLRDMAVMLFAVTSMAHGLGTVLPVVLNQPQRISALGQLGLLLLLVVFLLLGPFLLKDGPPHPGLVLCFFTATVCLVLLTVAAWQF